MPDCTNAPAEWRELKDLDDVCPDCIAGKQRHFGSHGSLPECTAPGQCFAMDLLILRTPDLFTNGTIMFGAIDLYSDWDLLIKIKYKTEVPECIKTLVKEAAAKGVVILRLHTDNENIFHTVEARESTISDLAKMGCLLTTGASYDHRQNSKIERHFERLGDGARPGFNQAQLPDKYYQSAIIDASAKHKLLPLPRCPGKSPCLLFTSKMGDFPRMEDYPCKFQTQRV